MAQDTLERERLIGNLIDRVEAAEQRIRRLEEMLMGKGALGDVLVPEPETGGWWRLIVEDPHNGAGRGLVIEEL